MATASPVDRDQSSSADVSSCTTNRLSAAADPLLSDTLLARFQFHSAPAGMADRIAAASERHASRQGRPIQHQGLQQGLPKSSHGLPHDPDSCRLWEARLLSRACQSLAFHISSHFHVPTGPKDPLASVLSSGSHVSTSASSSGGAVILSNIAAAAATSVPLPVPPPLLLQTGAAGATTTPRQHDDLHGMYDNLPAVYALKAVAGALVDPALWRSMATAPLPLQPPASPSPAAESQCSPSHNRTNDHRNHNHDTSDALKVRAGFEATEAPEPAAYQSPQLEAPSAMNALVHVVSAALLRLAHACGHPGCYSLGGQPPLPPSVAAAPPAVMRLAGVPFAGRQLTRLYDMARAAETVDVGALAGVPATAAAALLLLLATAQPPPHPAVVMTAAAASDRPPLGDAAVASCRTPAVPAALLARYLRVGSRSHNPLDTVRVMWALLRLQLPGAGPLLQPLELDGGSSSDAGLGAAATRPSSSLPLPPPPPRDPMAQLARILSRQLQNRDRALAALRAARPGELYGTWQLAVHTLVLLRDRTLANERSAAALAELDAALSLLEAALSGSSPSSGSGSSLDLSGSGLEFGTGSASADCSSAVPLSSLAPQQQQSRGQQRQRSTGSRQEASGGGSSSSAAAGSSGLAEATAKGPVVAAAEPCGTALEALQAFLELCREVSTSQPGEAPASGAVAVIKTDPSSGGSGSGGRVLDASLGTSSIPGWDLVPSSDSEWRAVLGDTEQRTALLISTWPELGRLVELSATPSLSITPPPPPLPSLLKTQRPQPSPSPSEQQRQQQQQQQAAPAANATRPVSAEANVVVKGVRNSGQGAITTGGAGGAVGETEGGPREGGEDVVQRRRLRIHLQSYSALHFRTLELLYRSVKAQAPDATLLAPLSAPEAAAAVMAAAAGSTAASVQVGVGVGTHAGGAELERSQQMLLDAVALPYSAAVDMVFTDARGRRVGLCLAHLGASRRAPGEIAVLQYALAGWPEADVSAVQQGFRAARSAARAAAAATAAAEASRVQMRAAGAARTTAAAAAATAAAFAMVGAAAAAAAAATAANQSCADGSDVAGRLRVDGTTAAAAQGCAEAATRVRRASAASAAAAVEITNHEDLLHHHNVINHEDALGRGFSNVSDDRGEEDCLSPEERVAAEAAAAALEADAAAVAAAPGVAAAAAAEAADAAAAAAVRAGRAFSLGPTAAAAPPLPPARNQDQLLQLDDVVVLELDHDWFHLRESYYNHVQQRGKWDPNVRQAIGAAMSYTELPWEAQLDMVWHVLATAGVELPIQVFA